MLVYNVFGRYLGILRKNECWLVFRVDLTERKYSRIYDVVNRPIPRPAKLRARLCYSGPVLKMVQDGI